MSRFRPGEYRWSKSKFIWSGGQSWFVWSRRPFKCDSVSESVSARSLGRHAYAVHSSWAYTPGEPVTDRQAGVDTGTSIAGLPAAGSAFAMPVHCACSTCVFRVWCASFPCVYRSAVQHRFSLRFSSTTFPWSRRNQKPNCRQWSTFLGLSILCFRSALLPNQTNSFWLRRAHAQFPLNCPHKCSLGAAPAWCPISSNQAIKSLTSWEQWTRSAPSCCIAESIVKPQPVRCFSYRRSSSPVFFRTWKQAIARGWSGVYKSAKLTTGSWSGIQSPCQNSLRWAQGASELACTRHGKPWGIFWYRRRTSCVIDILNMPKLYVSTNTTYCLLLRLPFILCCWNCVFFLPWTIMIMQCLLYNASTQPKRVLKIGVERQPWSCK